MFCFSLSFEHFTRIPYVARMQANLTPMIPKALQEVCRTLEQKGASTWLVGGCVRDMLLGKQTQDWDIEVFGIHEPYLARVLETLGRFEYVGKHFGVCKLWLDNMVVDIALPRKEKKRGRGHKGFDIVCDPNLTPEKASLRRDFTINALMYHPLTNVLLDFHRGQEDLKKRVLRHVSPAFVEDPLRPLRAMQFAARFGMTLDENTAALCRELLDEAASLPNNRVWQEWVKWSKSEFPSFGLEALRCMGWDTLYPELVALQGCPQDAYWHPEGDVWRHTCLVVDEAAMLSREKHLSEQDNCILLFSALCHDLGKPLATFTNDKGRVVAPNHGALGVMPSVCFLQRLGAPKWLIKHVKPLVKEHVAHLSSDAPTARAVKRLAERLEPSHVVMWEMLTQADASGRHPAPKCRPALAWLKLAKQENVMWTKAEAIVTGKLLQAWGVCPSPQMGKIIDKAYQAQMDGKFYDELSAFLWWQSCDIVKDGQDG